MIYKENIFVCLVAPLLLAAFLLRGETRRFIAFFIFGLLACLLAAYINSYFVAAIANNGFASLTTAEAMVQFTPICEEAMKALPVFFFAAVFRPQGSDIVAVAFAVGLGFATFENICYITQYGAYDFVFMLIRGLSAGITHAVCAAILGFGFAAFYRLGRLAMPVAFALLCVSSTFHSVYNLLVAGSGAIRTIGYVMPFASAAIILSVFLWRVGGLGTKE